MEVRNITIINSRTQNRTVFQSTAETLGELKVDLRDRNINFDGLAFFEGISKSELKDDTAILPKDLPWKGARTNDLVFMLTEPQKKIRNGAVASRMEAYAFIKANNLQAAVQKKFGDNFTRCKTNDLIDFCSKNSKKAAAPAKETKKEVKAAHKPVRKATQTKAEIETPAVEVSAKAPATPTEDITLQGLVGLLVAKGLITAEEVATGAPTAPKAAVVTDSDIQSMFRGIK